MMKKNPFTNLTLWWGNERFIALRHKGLSIGDKIALGFFLLLLLLAGIGLSSYLANVWSTRNMVEVQKANSRLMLAMQIKNIFADGNANATRFVASGDPKYYQQMEKSMSDAVVREYELENQLGNEMGREMRQLSQLTGKYSDIAMNDLTPLVKKYHNELAQGNTQEAQRTKTEMFKVNDRMVEMGEKVAAILNQTVEQSKSMAQAKIEAAGKAGQQANWINAVLGMIAFMAGAVLSIFFSRMIRKPIKRLLEGATLCADGDLTNPIPVTSRDELGKLAAAFNTMQDNLRTLIHGIFNSSRQVTGASEQLMSASDQSAQAAGQVSALIMRVSRGTETQMAAVREALSAMEQMSAGITRVAGRTDTLTEISRQTTMAAAAGGGAVNTVREQMKSIEQAVSNSTQLVDKLGQHSREIGKIVETINDIAAQTNLLALNAAIEAARAGEQGKGFAVVAEEVRKLAYQSQTATKQIDDLIRVIQNDTGQAVTAMQTGQQEVSVGTRVVQEAGRAFEQITGLFEQVSGQVDEISAAVHQMSAGSEQVVASMRDVDRISQDTAGQSQSVSALTQELSASTQQIAASSQELTQMAGQLQHSVDRFTL
ncbi:chemotaxis methyl-accepting receptor [Lucifera butyrica]|uniref:Chemotaxis methyl-accepting receptor n=1 Tax=Lucifera butyrica TaxID=1351585 RepID=A0A498R6C9_9FIRM|nr:HAMP domain-containing methyl-accepting chemotaxis protein [Lucifera butyrica]VBB07024.1 chemotaxis methyl-accepting receptor [Lucifera butyrica]